jgi:S1-C subfamily serine protease
MRLTTVIGLACLAATAAALADPAPIKKVEAQTAISVADRQNVAPAMFTRARTSILTTEQLGVLQEGIFCSQRGTFSMSAKLWPVVRAAAARAFRAEMTAAGYPSPVQMESSFDDTARHEVEFDVGVVVRKLQMNLCTRGKDLLGGVYVEAKWELYSKKSRRVVFEKIAEGSYENTSPETISFGGIIERAFAVSARNVLAERKFGDILAGLEPLPVAEAPVAQPVVLHNGTPPAGGVSQNAAMLRAAVVTINNGTGTGSGFFVTPEGYLLTNQHVVGDVKFVKVQLATGRELVGEVLKVDAKRDVALVKTEPIGAITLALRTSEPNIGEDVYAIGSPLGEKLSGTVTRGVLSGHRTIGEMRYIQSDVSVLPGNSGGPLLDASGRVVGISARAVLAGLANMNFFVPINEALSTLVLEIKD